MTRLPLSVRPVLAVLLSAGAVVATVATSPAPTGISAWTSREMVLSPASPSSTFHFTAHLSAAAHADGGIPVVASAQASTTAFIVGVDPTDDAGTWLGFAEGVERPVLRVELVDDLAGPRDGGWQLDTLALFENCPVAQACDQSFTLTVTHPSENFAPST